MKKQINDKIWQEIPSARKLIDKTIETIDNFDLEKNNFLFVHLLDPHERVYFFTYDSDDSNLIDEEFVFFNNYINNLDSSFKGSLIYQLSLLYVDNQIKRLFEFLKKKNIEDKFTIVILSDHGSSYTYNPIRKNVVNY
jgi:membrane-anchored protein YejM (alkaline phosphatase superfamily)